MARKSQTSQADDAERMIHIRINGDLHRRLRIHVAERDTSIQEWVAGLIDRVLTKIETRRPQEERTNGGQKEPAPVE